MTILIGLTGSIGMGKSTTARLFNEEGCPVWDADAAVHRLYAPGGAAVAPMAATFPEAIEDGAISRARLKAIMSRDPSALAQIESIVHPLVARDRADFVHNHRKNLTDLTDPSPVLVLDIPLLFETGADRGMDYTVVVSAPPEVQRARVLERGTMTPEQFENILEKQIPDAEKRARADYVIETETLESARQQVQSILRDIRQRAGHA
ncbi:Dephospho-CoA kinase [Roseovarius sp. EC-HK134]|uniref:dephospho-CoA kinase n=1 Tax=unclassified Roseovarius TaxID=2614913 RepID=UPI00125A07E8|nr:MULTISPECIES: dephospho-CoA kinase [unclassified Roseovarius]VVT10477.1 Dephospho-CoA kinase [Roseovarius sp. EC-HK134]VVT10704.1 Dephospho-CoA kinase [Roseovarius sp. EC-SD190]